jgi:hypothetical protein
METVFGRRPIPAKLPKEMSSIVRKLKHSKNKEACLRKAYSILAEKYRGYRFRTYLLIGQAFRSDLNYLWSKRGFMHCTNLNYLMRILLVKSGFFMDADIEQKWTLVWYVSPHQYLRVRTSKNKFVNVDVWNWPYGIGLGDYARGFHHAERTKL